MAGLIITCILARAELMARDSYRAVMYLYSVLVLYIQSESEPYRAAGQPHSYIGMLFGQNPPVPPRRIRSHTV